MCNENKIVLRCSDLSRLKKVFIDNVGLFM